jgi:hypothetical protein
MSGVSSATFRVMLTEKMQHAKAAVFVHMSLAAHSHVMHVY